MDSSNTMNSTAAAYLATVRFMKSLIGFTFITSVMVSSVMLYGAFSGSTTANPLFNSSYNWLGLAQLFILPILVLSIAYSVSTALIVWRSTKVELDSEGIEIQSGVMLKKVDFIPYSRIKALEMKQSPFQRLLNFTKVSIDYGGWSPEVLSLVSERKARHLQRQVANMS